MECFPPFLPMDTAPPLSHNEPAANGTAPLPACVNELALMPDEEHSMLEVTMADREEYAEELLDDNEPRHLLESPLYREIQEENKDFSEPIAYQG